MTKKLVLAMLILGVAAFAVPPALADGHDGPNSANFDFWLKSRIRYENLNNYGDFLDTEEGGAGSDRRDFWAHRTQFGFGAKMTDNVWFKMDIQNVGVFGGSESYRSSNDPLNQNLNGDGDMFGEEKSDTSIYRAAIVMKEIAGTGWGLSVGRQEVVTGPDGLVLGNEPFYGGVTHDGLGAWYKFDNWKVGGLVLKLAERSDPGSSFQPNGVYDDSGFGGSDDANLYGGWAKFGFKEDDDKQNLDAYYLMVSDASREMRNLEASVLGGAWYRHVKTVDQAEANPMSWKVELAIQSGERDVLDTDPNSSTFGSAIDEQDFDGWIFDGWFGWNFVSGDTIHTPFIGAFMTPGDDDQTDDDATGWQPLYPTEHGRLGKADYFNQGFGSFREGISATKIGWKMRSGKHKAYAQLWDFQPTEDEIEFGSGTVDVEDFGTEIDLGYSYSYTDNLKLFFSVAQMSPDDGLTGGSGQPDDAVTRVYGGFYLKAH